MMPTVKQVQQLIQQGEYTFALIFPLPALISLVLSMFLGEHVTGEFRLLILVAPCWMGASLASHRPQHVGRHSLLVSHCKGSHHGCFSRLHAQGPTIAAFYALEAQRCVLCRQGFFLSLSGSEGGILSIYSKSLPALLEGIGRLLCLSGLENNAISAPRLVDFLLHLFRAGLDLDTSIYHSAISAFLGPHHQYKASNHPVFSELMFTVYLQCPTSFKKFDPWGVKVLLSMIEIWAPASFLTDFKLPWKTATL